MRANVRSVLLAVCFAPSLLAQALHMSAQAPRLAATPPMGWNSWNWFFAKVSDKDIRQAADLLVSTGMRDAGYVYVNIDDGWQGTRGADGAIRANEKFPDMKVLGDYIHSRGLKFGVYSSPGPKTCAGYEGSLGHEEQDAKTYAGWGVDYLKYDLCSFGRYSSDKTGGDVNAMYAMQRAAWKKMHEAILQAGRPVVYSLCQYGVDAVWEWGPEVGANLWRTTGDISPNFDRITDLAIIQQGLERFAGPGHWNDPDMLEVGNGKLTHDENVLHMTMWSMLAAPLLAGNNLTLMSDDVKEILTNRDVIAVDQDSLGKASHVVFAEGAVQIWARPLADGSQAFAIVNLGGTRVQMRNMRLHLKEVGFPNGAHARDVWTGKDLGLLQEADVVSLPTRSAVLWKLSK